MIGFNLIPIIAAGIINGSFIIPSRYISRFSNEKIWLFHSFIGMLFLPWLFLLLTTPYSFSNYGDLSLKSFMFILLGGIAFGLGQITFASAIKNIGISLSFTINLGLGVILGSLFVILIKNQFFTWQGLWVNFAVILILMSLLLYYFADHEDTSQKYRSKEETLRAYHLGWLSAGFTGITSGLQNIVFFMLAFYNQSSFQANNSFWVWPPFLAIAAIPMLIGFYSKNKKNLTDNTCLHSVTLIKNMSLILLMGLFFTGSLALYSKGMSQLEHHELIVGWPALMVSIIFASQAWGWYFNESGNLNFKYKLYRLLSLLFLIIAILILALETQ